MRFEKCAEACGLHGDEKSKAEVMLEYDKEINGNLTEVRIYDSLSDFTDACRAYPLQDRYRDKYNRYARDGDFAGRKLGSLQGAYDAANGTWQDGLNVVGRFSQLLEKSLPTPVSRKRRSRWDELDGDSIDLDRMRSGQTFWRLAKRRHVSGPSVVSIVCTQQTSAGMRADRVMWRGAAAVALAKVLESAGYRVELWGAIVGQVYTDRTWMLMATRLKEARSPIDEATLANAVSGWFYRTVGFVGYHCSHQKRETQYGLGPVRPLTKEMTDEFCPNGYVIDSVFDFENTLVVARQILESIVSQNKVPA